MDIEKLLRVGLSHEEIRYIVERLVLASERSLAGEPYHVDVDDVLDTPTKREAFNEILGKAWEDRMRAQYLPYSGDEHHDK